MQRRDQYSWVSQKGMSRWTPKWAGRFSLPDIIVLAIIALVILVIAALILL